MLNMSSVAGIAKNDDINWKAYFIYSILMGNLIDLETFFVFEG